MLSISSIISAISGRIGAGRNVPEARSPVSSIANRSETVDDFVSISARGLKAANRAQPDRASQGPTVNTDSATTKTASAASDGLAKSMAAFNPQRGPEEPIAKARIMATAALEATDPAPLNRAVADLAKRLATETRQEIAAQQKKSAQSSTSTKPFSQKNNSNTDNSISPDARRAVAAYQENRDVFSIVVQTSSFRASA
jgi:hypothetical protein